jgi:hypothetical protein
MKMAILLNIITIIIASVAIVIMYKLKTSASGQDEQVTATDTFESSLKDPSNVLRGYYADKRLGDIGTFVGSVSTFSNTPSVL